jgi:RNA 2',3'-cyclic 3'-phosphodiesterase
MKDRASVGSDERLRLFVALRLPPDTVERLAAWQAEELGEGGRIVPPDHLHLTLAFLGGTPAGRLDAVLEELRAAAGDASRPVLRVARYRETRNVGMLALEDDGGRSIELALDVQTRLEALGVYRREYRSWLPHVTVLRFRDRPRLRPPLPDLGDFSPSEAAAYLSRLHPSGARYEVLESVPLGG